MYERMCMRVRVCVCVCVRESECIGRWVRERMCPCGKMEWTSSGSTSGRRTMLTIKECRIARKTKNRGGIGDGVGRGTAT